MEKKENRFQRSRSKSDSHHPLEELQPEDAEVVVMVAMEDMIDNNNMKKNDMGCHSGHGKITTASHAGHQPQRQPQRQSNFPMERRGDGGGGHINSMPKTRMRSTSLLETVPSSSSSPSSSTRHRKLQSNRRFGGKKATPVVPIWDRHGKKDQQSAGHVNLEAKRRTHAQWKRYRTLRDETICKLTRPPWKLVSQMEHCSHRVDRPESSCQWNLFVSKQRDPFESVTVEDYSCFVDVCCNGNVNPLSPAQIEDIRAGEPLSRVVLSLQEHVWAVLMRANELLMQCRREHSSENRMRSIMDRARKNLDKLQGSCMRNFWSLEGQADVKQLQRWFGLSAVADDCIMSSNASVMLSSSGDSLSPTTSRMSVSDSLETTSIMSSSTLTDFTQDSLLGNCIEKWLFEHLYFCTFQISEQDTIHDNDLRNRLTTFRNFIEPRHLGLIAEYQENSDFTAAVTNLRKMNQYTTPTTKLNIIKNAMDDMFKALTTCYPNQEDQNCDMMVPATVLLLLRANPRNLHSSMKFMRMWCDNEKVSFGESGFWFTTLEAAQWFIERATESSFEDLEPKEYMRSVNANNSSGKLSRSIVWDWHV